MLEQHRLRLTGQVKRASRATSFFYGADGKMSASFASAKVYGLRPITGGDIFYVGSTIQTLDERLIGHRKKAFEFPRRKLYERFTLLGAANVEIVLINAVECDSRDALLMHERRAILEHNTISAGCNTRLAGGREDGRWKSRNRQRHLEYCRGWNLRARLARAAAP